MLDALLAEARLRWGLDPADGMAVIPAERLVGLPLEPTRPVVIVPLAALRVPHLPAPPAPLPGRHGHGGDLSLIHISEPTRLGMISYAVFCLKKKKKKKHNI